jgi:hypothetical protein
MARIKITMATNFSVINIAFPILCIYEGRAEVIQRYEKISRARKARIPGMKKLLQPILDCNGNEYSIIDITPKGYINPFFGFSLGHAGFGVCNLDIEYEKVKALSVEELKLIGGKIIRLNEEFYTDRDLQVERWVSEFNGLSNREDVLRYMFYLANPLYYNDPGVIDTNWRDRRYVVR